MQTKGRYEIDMCSGPILPKLLQFALPLMLSGILQLLFNAADVIVVGRFAGDNSLGAVGSTTHLISLLVNLFIGLSVGANIMAARFYGANDRESLHQTVHTAMLLSVLCGAVLALVGCCFAPTFLGWMQSPDGVRGLATLYLRIYFLGVPATLVYNFGAALLRAAGDTRRPLYFLFAAGILNVLMNLFLVIVCHLDVAGVAIATVLSQCVSAVLIVRCLLRDSGGIRLEPRKLHLWPQRLKEILQVGLPAGLQSVLFAISNVVIQSSINSFGEVIVAAGSASASISNFVYTAMNAFSQANTSFTGQNLGAKRYDRIIPVLTRSLACVTVTGLVTGGLAVLFGHELLGIYSDSPDVIAAGYISLFIRCAPYFLCGVMEVFVGSLRGLGYSMRTMVISLLGSCGLRLLWLATVFPIPRFHTIETVYFSYPFSWGVTALMQAICFLLVWKRLRRSWETP